tara:strand:+ start:3371 stop:4432 length:1062 start_codon:yes stop_codon:yes gene_type:complete
MKTGKSLSALAAEIDRQSSAKRDFVAATRSLEMIVNDEGAPALAVPGVGAFGLNGHAGGQLANHLDIPKRYFDKMSATAPALLADNINVWLKREDAKSRRMIRTLDGGARAFLSDRYQPFDNDLVAGAALETLQEAAPDMVIQSADLTPTKLYIKASFPSIQREVKKGDVVESGVVISTSEVGAGAVDVAPFSTRLVCLNGMKHTAFGARRNHVGRVVGGQDGAEIFATDTLRADVKAFLLRLRDVIRSTVDPVQFAAIVSQMADAAAQPIVGDVVQVVEVTAKRLALSEGEKSGVLRHLIQGGDLSRWGLANAVTRAAEDCTDYDRASDLEALGGRIVEMPQASWREISQAA